jgi:hypothetical protein
MADSRTSRGFISPILLLAGPAAGRHVDLQRGRHAVSRLPRFRGRFERNIAVAGGRPARDPDGTLGAGSRAGDQRRSSRREAARLIQIKRPSETLSSLRSGRTCIPGLVTPGTDSNLGNENWGLGPTAVVLRLEKDNPWVYGMLINNVWSLDTSSTAPKYNNFLLQPFVNCNLPGGHLHQQRADHHGELGGQQRQPVDRAAGGGGRAHLPLREAAGERTDPGVLQHHQTGQWSDLSAARAGAVHVSEVMGRATPDDPPS